MRWVTVHCPQLKEIREEIHTQLETGSDDTLFSVKFYCPKVMVWEIIQNGFICRNSQVTVLVPSLKLERGN